jgi:hypothetical protein
LFFEGFGGGDGRDIRWKNTSNFPEFSTKLKKNRLKVGGKKCHKKIFW